MERGHDEMILHLPGMAEEKQWLSDHLETLSVRERIVLSAAMAREPPKDMTEAVNCLLSLDEYEVRGHVGNYAALGEFFLFDRCVPQAGQYLEKQAKEAYENCRCRHGTEVIGLNIGKMNEYSEMIRNRMIYLALSECSGTVKDITAEHVGQAAALTGKQTGKKISLPYYMYARRQYEYLRQ